MGEKIIRGEATPSDRSFYSADVDVSFDDQSNTCRVMSNEGFGSVVAISDGFFLGSSHVGTTPNGDSVSGYKITLRKGLSNQSQSDSIGLSDRFEPKPYNTDPSVTDDLDLMILDSDISNAPQAPIIIFEDLNDANGLTQAYGYPNTPNDTQDSYDGDTLVESTGSISKNKSRDLRDSEVIDFDLDRPEAEGAGAIGGMSGGGVWLDYTKTTDHSNMLPDASENFLIGNLTYGSGVRNSDFIKGANPCSSEGKRNITSMDATDRPASFTPFNKESYTPSMDWMAGRRVERQIEEEFNAQRDEFRAEIKLDMDAARDDAKAEYEAAKNAVKEERAAAKQAEKDGGPEYNRSEYPMPDQSEYPMPDRYSRRIADAELRQNIASDPDLNDRVSERFSENTMIADIGAEDGTSSTFNGSAFRETLHANANVNTTSNMGHGRDGVDFRSLEHGVTVEIGANASGASIVDVTKTYEKSDGSGTATAQDQYTDVEVISGTGSDDTFIIRSFSDIEEINGRDPASGDDRDTLRLGEEIGPVSWEFKRNVDGTLDQTQGVVEYQGRRVEFSNIENVETRDGDAVNGQVQGPAPDVLKESLENMRLEEQMDNIRHLNTPDEASYEANMDYAFS